MNKKLSDRIELADGYQVARLIRQHWSDPRSNTNEQKRLEYQTRLSSYSESDLVSLYVGRDKSSIVEHKGVKDPTRVVAESWYNPKAKMVIHKRGKSSTCYPYSASRYDKLRKAALQQQPR